MSYEAAVLADSPRRYHRLQDSLADNSGNGGAALVRGASTAEPQFATGIVDASPRGLLFDGTADYAYVPAAWTDGSNKATFTFWANFAAFSGVQVILEAGTDYNTGDGNTGCQPIIYSDGTDLQIGLSNFVGSTIVSDYDTWTFPLPSTNDTHVAIVFDRTLTGAGRCKVYYNAVAQTASASSTTTRNTGFIGRPLYLMSRAGGAYFTGGLLDDLAIWMTAVSELDIAGHWQAGQPTTPAYISGSSNAVANGALSLGTGGPATLSPNASNAAATGSLALTANQRIAFNASNAAATGSLDLTTVSATGARAAPGWLGLFITDTGGSSVPLIAGGSNAVATGSLTLLVPSPALISGSSTATASGALTLRNTTDIRIATPTGISSTQTGSSTVTSVQFGNSHIEPSPNHPVTA